jgi:DNA-binding GntR family transcriptional regulator
MQCNPRIDIESIYIDLRKQIINRSLPPNTRLSESNISRCMNVSRTTIREALRRLEAEGFVSFDRCKGFKVSAISLRDIEELYTIKISLEGLAGRLATPIIGSDPQKLNTIEGLCREMDLLFNEGDIEGYAAKNDQLHNYIWQSCENKWLIKYLENLSSQVMRFVVRALYMPKRMKNSVKEHRLILKHMKAGNGKGVERAIAGHFQKSLDGIRNELRQ